MNSKKKLIIAFSSLGVICVGLIISLVAVLAAFSFTATTGVDVTYEASDVITGKIAASYKLEGDTDATSIGEVTLNGVDTTGDMGEVDAELSKEKTYIDFIFEVQNTTNIPVYATITIPTTLTNAEVSYSTNGTSFSETALGEQTIAAGTSAAPTTATYYVRVAIDNLGQDFAIAGDFAVALSDTAAA